MNACDADKEVSSILYLFEGSCMHKNILCVKVLVYSLQKSQKA